MRKYISLLVVTLLTATHAVAADLEIRHDKSAGTISVYRVGEDEAIVTQNARPDYRPYIHPIVAPDGKGVLTQYQPTHHPHQTGLYWGFTQVNGRDYFHHPEGDYWRRVSAVVLKPNSTPTDLNVRWQTIYDLLDEDGEHVLRETQVWTMREEAGEYALELEWTGTAVEDVTIGEYDYGGLFLSTNYVYGADGEATNSVRQTNARAEGQRAVWVDVGVKLEGRDDRAHIAIFDHTDNVGYPQPWRVDKALGFGPVRARTGDWTIPAGESEVIKHGLRVYTGDLNDVELTDIWSLYAREIGEAGGKGGWSPKKGIPYAQWGLAKEEGYAAEFLTAEKAAAAMTYPEAFTVDVFASEPMINQPMAFCWDDRGRLWIAQNREMMGSGAGIQYSGESQILILEDTDGDGVADSRKVFLEDINFPSAMAVGFDGLWLGAIPNLLFVPDRDGDDKADVDDIEIRLTGWGKQDLHETINSFHWGPDGWLYGLQGIFTPSRVGKPAGQSAVYVPDFRYPTSSVKKADSGQKKGKEENPIEGKTISIPMGDEEPLKIQFNDDGKAIVSGYLEEEGTFIETNYKQDGKSVYVEIFETTVELIYDGETLVFGEKGGGSSDASAFEYDGEPVEINGAVWRYHPTKDRFEIIANGFSNPWGIDYDAKGQIFISACVIPHLWHVVQGGRYHRQAGSHFNPHTYSDIRTIGDHRHRSAHGGARVYLSDAFPEEYQGRLFMGNIHEHAVLIDELEPTGSGFVGHHAEDFLHANNAQFVGFSTEIGPDGSVYMLDWHDADICGDFVRTKDTGRVYRISPKESGAENWEGRYGDLATFDNAELVKLQESKSAWHSRRARVILQNRATKGDVDKATHKALRAIFDDSTNEDHRLRALWALHVTQGIDQSALVEILDDDDMYVRAWAIQLLCEDNSPSNAALKQFVTMAKNDSSPVVRLYLASALQRIGIEASWPIAENLITHAEDADDHNIPHVLWYGIELLVADDPARALEMAKESGVPMITQYIARRLTDEDKMTSLVSAIGEYADARLDLLQGMRDGLEGRSDAVAPENWAKVFTVLRAEQNESSSMALELSLQFGDAVAAQALVDTLQSDENSLEDRRRAIRGLAQRKRPELKPQLIALLDSDTLRADAIRATASYDDAALADTLLDRYASFSTEEKLEVVHALSSRPSHGTQLVEAIKNGDVPREDVPAYIARLLQRVVGNRFLEVWGPVEGDSPEIAVAFDRLKKLLVDEAFVNADKRKGRELFNQTCFACHQLYGEGGQVGPDLTGSNRTDINYLLGNILTPSAVIKEDYKMTMVFTHDGQVYSGVVVSETNRQLTLRVASGQEPVSIPKSQIADRELTDLSMMPDGLIDHLSDPEVIDLIAYLRSLEPVMMQDRASR